MKKAGTTSEITIEKIGVGRTLLHVVGTTPLIMHRFALKAWHELLLPAQKKNAAAKQADLKHDPLEEFRQCCYRNRNPKEPTLLHYPSGAFSKAIASAALDIPGANKSQILRLVSITSTQINLYGTPMLGMDMVRSGDMARTPDVRTRAYLPDWCASIEVEYVRSLIGEAQIVNLLAAAGVIVGLGDYRPQKGGQFGKFITTLPDDAEFLRIKKQARAAQEAALASPDFFNDDSAELYSWFCTEIARREKVAPSSLKDGKPEVQAKKLALVAASGKRNGGKSKSVAAQ